MAAAHPFGAFIGCRFKRIGCVRQIKVKGIVLYFWSSSRYIKSWIVIYYRGLKFPHRAVVLLVLESDGACTGLNGHCARKCAVLVLVWCYKSMGDREQDLWRCCLSEGCIKQWCEKPSGCGCVSKKCGRVEQWSSDLAVSCNLTTHCDIQWKHRIKNIMTLTTDQNPHWHSR